MRKLSWLRLGWLAGSMLLIPLAHSQPRPYAGYVYPAGGQQGKTFQIRLGGQNMDDVNAVEVSGAGVTTRIVEFYWRQNNQEQALLNEQLQILKKKYLPASLPSKPAVAAKAAPPVVAASLPVDPEIKALMDRITRRTGEWVQTPAAASLASLLFVEVTVAPDAAPGERELRVVTLRGVSNPLPFHIGQLPEYSRKPMRTALLQVLGKESQALRKRPPEEVEDRIELPCTLNGQIASGETNRYRFTARKGQRLILTTQARQLIPYIADAVPGWFQPVLILYDADGKEVAYNDDYRFKPDPAIFFEVPKDGEYVFAIYDSIYRGREDFIYRITAGELPFVTSIFPLGANANARIKIRMKGWNLDKAELVQPPANAGPGAYWVTANREGFVSNRVPFALDTLPDSFEKEPNNDLKHAEKLTLPVMINGRIDRPGDWDVYQFTGKANETVVAEVYARRLDSPLDSVLKLTDTAGKVIAFNDDHEDLGSGLNTHHADSYLMAKLPAAGVYFVHIGDTARHGGEEYAYRLRISAPMPDFELRVVPSSISLRSKNAAYPNVYVIRKDGFNAPIRLALKDPPAGITSQPSLLRETQAVVGLAIRTTLVSTPEPFSLVVEGRAMVGKREIVHEAVPAEDRMQAFLWRHLIPAEKLMAVVFDPGYTPPPMRVLPTRADVTPAVETLPAKAADTNTSVTRPPTAPLKPKFTAQQVASRLRDLKRLYGAGYLTDQFYLDRVAECEVTQ